MQQTPFAQVLVTLAKQEYTQLVWDANYWKSAHQRALARMLQLEADHQQAIAQSALREATLRDELNIAQARSEICKSVCLAARPSIPPVLTRRKQSA